MIYSKEQIRKRVDEMLDNGWYEDACFLIAEGLSMVQECGPDDCGVYQMDFDDNEVIGIMEKM